MGLALAGPGATGLALADSPEDATPSSSQSQSSAPATTADPRAEATRSAASRGTAPQRESRTGRAPGSTAGSSPAAAQQSRAEAIPAAASAAVDVADPGTAGDGDAPAPEASTPDVPAVADSDTPDGDGSQWVDWVDYTSAPLSVLPVATPMSAGAPAVAAARPVRVPTTVTDNAPIALAQRVGQFLDGAISWLSTLPKNPVTDFVSGVLLLVRRSLPGGGGGGVGGAQIAIPELDSSSSPLAVRVNPTQDFADGIKVNSSAKPFTLTLPGPASNYAVLANKPALVDIAMAGNQIRITPKTPGFLGLSIKSLDGQAARYLGLYIADHASGIVPDMSTVNGKPPVGTVARTDGTGDKFLEDFNFRDGVAPIDYLYIYDQGGADYTDGNLTGLLTQAVRHGLVPVVVYYNIQAVDTAAGKTGVVEGPNAAYQAINDYNWSDSKQTDPNLFTGYMKRYFTKLATDFTTMNRVGVPVQVVVEPDFLGYMAANLPAFQASTFVPNSSDRTLNTAKVSSMYDAGLLTRGTDPDFPDTVAGLVQAINYYTATKMPNLRLGWKTNIWAVADQKNNSLGLLHVTDTSCPSGKCIYPWQFGWVTPVGWDDGRPYIQGQATQLGAFLKKVGVTSWTGSAARAPFLAIDKYGVDGAYTYDPRMLAADSNSATFGDLSFLIYAASVNKDESGNYRFSDSDVQKYFGLANRAEFKAFYEKYQTTGYNKTADDVKTVFTALQNAAAADPNLAKWFLNADQWNNYLYLVQNLSTALDGTKVMLWQIPQGHINGSTAGRDLANADTVYEDSATSYFFGDTFTPTGPNAAGRFTHFTANYAKDAKVTYSGNTITWGEHMTEAGQSGVMSVLFGAGLGLSTRGSPTPAGDVTDQNFWYDKATGYLTTAARG